MAGFNIYQLILSLIVYLLLVILLGVVVFIIIKLTLKLIASGIEDYEIKKEYYDNLEKQNKRVKMPSFLKRVPSLLFCCLIVAVFIFSIIIKINENRTVGDIPLVKVVASGSMSKKHKENVYLYSNKLDNQFQTFDIIVLEKLPDEFDIKLYDVIMYEYDGVLIIHRVIKIEEPNSEHPNSRRFKFRGDAIENSDRFDVTYDQMRGIYKGSRVPFVGSFVFFLQSPAGVMCIVLVIFVVVILPIIEKKINQAKRRRLMIVGVIKGLDDKELDLLLSSKKYGLKRRFRFKRLKQAVVKIKYLSTKQKLETQEDKSKAEVGETNQQAESIDQVEQKEDIKPTDTSKIEQDVQINQEKEQSAKKVEEEPKEQKQETVQTQVKNQKTTTNKKDTKTKKS